MNPGPQKTSYWAILLTHFKILSFFSKTLNLYMPCPQDFIVHYVLTSVLTAYIFKLKKKNKQQKNVL